MTTHEARRLIDTWKDNYERVHPEASELDAMMHVLMLTLTYAMDEEFREIVNR